VGKFYRRGPGSALALPQGGPFTLFGQPASPATLTTDLSSYTMGVQFTVSRALSLKAVWFFSPAGAGSLPGTISLYQVSGASLITSQAATWSGAVASGWVRAAFTTPPALTAATAYKACINNTGVAASWYASTAHYWDTGAGSGGVSNGPLSAPNNAGGDGGQDTFNTAPPAYPATSFNATNYWLDPEVG
jgi:hypothetical protein